MFFRSKSYDHSRIVMYVRKSAVGQYSIESYFSRVFEDLKELGIPVEWKVAPRFSRGLANRLVILFDILKLGRVPIHFTGDITFAALACRGPSIVTFHDVQVLSRLNWWYKFIVRVFWFVLPAARSTLITVNSYETAQRLIETVPSLNIDDLNVIYVSVDEIYQRYPKSFNRQQPRILQVGTKMNKNVFRLVRALTVKELRHCHLVIVGRIDKELFSLLNDSRISYENHEGLSAEELLMQYRQCDLLAFASIEEGFGMPIVEAQRIGRPVLTSSHGAMREIAGEAACLVDPVSVESIRDGIRAIVFDDLYRASLINKGFTNAIRFDRREIARRYSELYSDLLGRGLN